MNQTTFQEYLSRLPEDEPFQICRICIQETQYLISNSDTGFYEIRILYECITNLKVMGATEYPYYICAECINTLRKIGRFQDMSRIADMFWKKYVQMEPSNYKQTEHDPIIKSDEETVVEQIYFESTPQEADVLAFEHSSNALKLESDDSDIDGKCVEGLFYDSPEKDSNTNTTVVDLKIERGCDICDEEFSSKEFFEKHKKAHKRRFNCAHCGLSFRFKSSVLLHLKQIHSEGVATNPYKWICTSCDNLELSSKVSLRTHIQQYHGPGDEAKCPECKKTFGNLKKLIWHMATHREKPYQCSKCPKQFKNKCFLDKHSATHSNIRPYVCEQCGIGLASNNGLKRHILGVHQMKKQKKYRRTIKCTLCDAIFPNLLEAKAHFHSKHSQAQWKEFRSLCCGVCYIRFESTAKRQEHYSQYQTNHDKSKSKLKKLGPRNYVSWTLTQRPHQCDICMNTFRTPDSLKGHMKIHPKKPRPFKCEICGAKHAVAFDLRLHILRAHTADRPFNCSECDYNCVTRTELNNHIKWNHTAK